MYTKFISALSSHSRILVIPHTRHDGDALGSGLGLCHLISQLGSEAKLLIDDVLPDNLDWLPGIGTYGVRGNQNQDTLSSLFEWAEMILLTDFSSTGRVTDKTDESIALYSKTKAIIDHHPEGNIKADLYCIDTTKPATCEVILDQLNQSELLHTITLDCARCLYTGLITDTHSFKFRQTGINTHKYAAELFRLGVNNSEIQTKLYDENSFSRLQLMGAALSNIEVLNEYPVALIHLTTEELSNAKQGETNGLVNLALSIKGVELAVSAFDFPDQEGIKLSFRSLGTIAANTLAKEFSGGGHLNAAGGHSSLSLEETLQKIKQHVHLIF